MTNIASPDEVLDSYSYRFNDKGLRGRVTWCDGRYTDYDYDSLYRLTKETRKTAQARMSSNTNGLSPSVGFTCRAFP